METSHYPEFKTSSQRALVFLNLAIEQLRLFDDTTAGVLMQKYYTPLEQVFQQAVDYANTTELPALSRREARILYEAGSAIFTDMMEKSKLAPPGLGRGLFREEKSRIIYEADGDITPRASRFQTRPGSSASSYTDGLVVPSYGAIGARRASTSATDSTRERITASTSLFELLGGSEPLEKTTVAQGWNVSSRPRSKPEVLDELSEQRKSAESYMTAQTLASKATYTTAKSEISSAGPNLPRFPEPEITTKPEDAKAPTITITVEEYKSLKDGPGLHQSPKTTTLEASKQEPSTNVPSTWAAVAAISPSTRARTHQNLSIASTTSSLSKALKPPTFPYEKPAEQRRVVWLFSLPQNTTLHEVSQKILHGPIYSILLSTAESKQHGTYPSGASACVIFQHAASAAALVSDAAASDKTIFPPGTKVVVGGPFPLDADLHSMSTLPHPRRRRLKWSRSRLFYDVSLLAFKKLVVGFAGGNANVEFLHFYNAGEATAVFASVGVAKAVFQGFKTLRAGLGGVGAGAEALAAAAAAVWKSVEMSFVTDFNEKPVQLFSQYDKAGQIRCFAPGKKGEGLFAGPVVRDEEVFGTGGARLAYG